jgi:hypothetical protein
METWGTVTWGLKGENVLPVDELSRFNMAIKVVFDLNEIDAATLWDLIPFSWLIDYFTNVGDLLQSAQMRYVIQPYDICIMREFLNDTTTIVTDKPSSVVVTGTGSYTRHIKTRDVVFPSFTPSLSFDLLTGDRWKVVAALLASLSGRKVT